MNLRELEQKAIEERIKEFHYYLDHEVPVEKAKKIILESTVFNKVIEYVNNFK